MEQVIEKQGENGHKEEAAAADDEEEKEDQLESSEQKFPEPEIISFNTQDVEQDIKQMKENYNEERPFSKDPHSDTIPQQNQQKQFPFDDSMASFMSSLPQLVNPNYNNKDQRNIIDQHWLINSGQQNESGWISSVNSHLSVGQMKIGTQGLFKKFTQSQNQNQQNQQQNQGQDQFKELANNLLHQDSIFQESGQFDHYMNMFVQANQQFQTGNKGGTKITTKNDANKNSNSSLEDMIAQKLKSNLTNIGLDVIDEIASIKIGKFSMSNYVNNNTNNKNTYTHNINNNQNITASNNSYATMLQNSINTQVNSNGTSKLPALKTQKKQPHIQKQRLFEFFEQVPSAIKKQIKEKNRQFTERIKDKQFVEGNEIGSKFSKAVVSAISNQNKKDYNGNQHFQATSHMFQSQNKQIAQSHKQSQQQQSNQQDAQQQPLTRKPSNPSNIIQHHIQSQALTQTSSTTSLKQIKGNIPITPKKSIIHEYQNTGHIIGEENSQNDTTQSKINIKQINHINSGNNHSYFPKLQNPQSEQKEQYNNGEQYPKHHNGLDSKEQIEQKQHSILNDFKSEQNLYNQSKQMNENQQNTNTNTYNNNNNNNNNHQRWNRDSFNYEQLQNDVFKENTSILQNFYKNSSNLQGEFYLQNTQVNPSFLHQKRNHSKSRTHSKNTVNIHDFQLPDIINQNNKLFNQIQTNHIDLLNTLQTKVKNGYPSEQSITKQKKKMKVRVNQLDNSYSQNTSLICQPNVSQISISKNNLSQFQGIDFNNHRQNNNQNELNLREFDDSLLQDPTNCNNLTRNNKFINQDTLNMLQLARNMQYQSVSPVLNLSKKLSPNKHNQLPSTKQQKNLQQYEDSQKTINFIQNSSQMNNNISLTAQNKQQNSLAYGQHSKFLEDSSSITKKNTSNSRSKNVNQIQSQYQQQLQQPPQCFQNVSQINSKQQIVHQYQNRSHSRSIHTELSPLSGNYTNNAPVPGIFLVRKAHIFNRQN